MNSTDYYAHFMTRAYTLLDDWAPFEEVFESRAYKVRMRHGSAHVPTRSPLP